MSYNAKVYRTQGGNTMVVGNGGTVTVESGGTLDCQAGSTVNLPAGLSVSDLALTYGSVLIGNSGNAAAAVDAKSSGQILVGNGTTLASVAVGGDAALAANGALTVSKIGGAANSGYLPVGNGSALVVVAVSGDAALAANGALTVSKIGGTANSAYVPVGNGTALVNVAVSGDVALASNGAVTVGNGTITTVKVAGGAVTGAKMAATGLKAASFLGANAAGSITLTGAVAGDRVLALFRSDNAGAIASAANFETTISANDAIQQTTNEALGPFVFSVILIPASA